MQAVYSQSTHYIPDPDRKSLVYSESHPTRKVYSCAQCAVQRKLVYNGSLLSSALCVIMWPPSTQATTVSVH
jgi:hypothetical protein